MEKIHPQKVDQSIVDYVNSLPVYPNPFAPKAERSEVLQGCPPSANCSAGAGADAQSDSLNSSPVPREKRSDAVAFSASIRCCDMETMIFTLERILTAVKGGTLSCRMTGDTGVSFQWRITQASVEQHKTI